MAPPSGDRTKGWSSFDQRRKANAGDGANDVGGENVGVGEPDMFGLSGVQAAE